VQVYAVKVKEKMNMDDLYKLKPYISKDKLEKIKKYSRTHDIKMTLIADILARYLICKTTNLNNTDIYFNKNKFGKPMIRKYNKIYFNISHSFNMVICAVDSALIGIDIEYTNKIDLSSAEIFMTQEEFLKFMKKNENEKSNYFYTIWTLKESYVKACGEGLVIPFSSLNIKMSSDILSIETNNDFNDCYFKVYNLGNSYKVSICSKNRFFVKNINVINFDELIVEFLKYC
jgi:4'-phosphopantetheinyl transferase